MSWDYETQKAETFYTVEELSKDKSVPVSRGDEIDLDLQLLPEDDADEAALIRALGMFGYAAGQGEDGDYIEVVVPGVAFTGEAIWLHEERVTKIALERGYTPDGWGFMEP